MSSDEEKLKLIKSEIRSLLISCPVGLNLGRFLKDYHECLGYNLPFRDFGYKTAWDFLLSIPDVVQIKETLEGKLLVPVENKLNSHIHQLVTKQRKQKTGHRSGRTRRKSAYVNFNHSYFTIERKKKYRKTWEKSSFSTDDDSFISDFDELCLIRSDNDSTKQTVKYQTKRSSKSCTANQSKNISSSNFSAVSLNSSSKLKSNLPKLMGKIPTAEIERFDNLQRYTKPLESESDDFSDEIQVSYRLKNTSCCYILSSDTDESQLSKSLPEFQQSNDEISNSEGEDSFNIESFVPHKEEKERSADKLGIYVKDYSPLHTLPKNYSNDTKDEISYQLKRFPSCEVLAERRELKNEGFFQKDALEVQMIISDEHDRFLTALANGVILDPDKVLEPYIDQLDNEKNFNYSYSSNSDSSLYDNSSTTSSYFDNSKPISIPFSSRNKNNNTLSKVISLTAEQRSVSYDDTTSVQSSNDKTEFQSLNNNSKIMEFKKLISSRYRQNSNELSENLKSDEIDKINPISDESITRNIGRGSVIKKLYDAFQMRVIKNENDSIATNGNGRGLFLKKLVERTSYCHS